MQSGATVEEGKGKVRSGSELLDVFEVSFLVISILLVTVLERIVKFDRIPNTEYIRILKIHRIPNTEYIRFLKNERIRIPNSAIRT